MADDLTTFMTNPANVIGVKPSAEGDDLSSFMKNTGNIIGAGAPPVFNRDKLNIPGAASSTVPIETQDMLDRRDLAELGQESWGENRFINIPAATKTISHDGVPVRTTAIPGTAKEYNVTRMDIGMSSTPEAKRAKFLDKFPEGDFKRLASGRYVFKMNAEDPWSLYNEDFTKDAAGASAVIAENLPDFALAYGGGATVKVGKAFLIGAAARVGINAVDRARGYNEQAMLGEVADALGDGAASALGTMLGNFIVGTGNAATARGMANVSADEKELIAWAKKNNMPHLIPSQLHTFGTGVVNRLSSFSKHLGTSIDDHLISQGDAVIQKLAELRGMNIRNIDTPPQFQEYLHRFKGSLTQLITNGEKVGWNDGGKAIKELVDLYQDHAQKAINLKFERLNEIANGGLRFDVSEAAKMAEDFANGVTFKIDPAKTRAGRPIKDLNIAQSIIETNRVNFSAGGLRGMSETNPLYQAIQTLRLMDPQVAMTVGKGGNVFNGYQQIDHIIQNLNAFLYSKSTENPITDSTERAVKQMVTSLQESLGRPSYMGETSKAMDRAAKDPAFAEFGKLLEDAKTMAKEKYELLDNAKILRLYNTEEPARVAKQLAKPDNEESLTALNTMATRIADHVAAVGAGDPAAGTKLLTEYRTAFKTSLMNNTDKMKSVLDSMDAGTLNMLVPEAAERRKLYDIAGVMDTLKSSQIQKQLVEQTTIAGQVLSLVELAQKRGVTADILFEITGGANTEAGKVVKAGIVQNLFDNILDYSNRKWGIQHRGDIETTIFKHFENLKTTRLDRYFTKEELKNIEQIAYYAGKTIGNSDAGTSLVAAQVAAGASHFNPSKIAELYKYKAAGWFLTSKPVAFLSQGAPESKLFGLVGGQKIEKSSALDGLLAGITSATTDSARSTNTILSVYDRLQQALEKHGVSLGGK